MRRMALLFLALLVGACDDGLDPVGGLDPRVDVVQVGPATATLLVGDTLRLTAEPRTAAGDLVDVPVTWAASEAARVTILARGRQARITAVRAGAVQVTATAGGKSGEAVLAVWNPAPTLSALQPASTPEGTSAFTLTVMGTGFTHDSRVRWNGAERPSTLVSATELAAQIGAEDVAAEGAADVTVVTSAPGGGASTALSFTIERVTSTGPVASVELDADSLVLDEGVLRQLTATPLDAQGQPVPDKPVLWTTSDETVAYVSAGGVVRAVRTGLATITARVDGKTASAQVRVRLTVDYDLVFQMFTGTMTQVFRTDIAAPSSAFQRIFGNARWASDPAVSPDGEWIAVVRNDSTGSRGIWIVNRDATQIVELTTGDDDQPTWSPDGERIAFRHRPAGEGTEIWTVRRSDLQTTNLTPDLGGNQSYPSWSATGRIAYAYAMGAEAHIWTMAQDGTDRVQVTTGAQYDQAPSWSPDGAAIAFERLGDIWAVNPASGALRLIASLPFGQFAPAWSPDGQLVAFSSKDAASTYQIFTARADGTGVAQRTWNTDAYPTDWQHKEHPAWQPRP